MLKIWRVAAAMAGFLAVILLSLQARAQSSSCDFDEVCERQEGEDQLGCSFDCPPVCDVDCASVFPGSQCLAKSPTEAACVRPCECSDPLGGNCRASTDDCADIADAFDEPYCCARDFSDNYCQPVSKLTGGAASCGFVPVCVGSSSAEFACMRGPADPTPAEDFLYVDPDTSDDLVLSCNAGEGSAGACFGARTFGGCSDRSCTSEDSLTGLDYCCASEGGPELGVCAPRVLVSQQSSLLGMASGTCLDGAFTPHVPGCECLLPPQPAGNATHGNYLTCVARYLKDHGLQSRGDIKAAADQSKCLGSK